MASSTYPSHKLAWRDRHAPTLADFERLAKDAYRHLPAEFRMLTGEIMIRVAEFPDEDVLEDLVLDTPFELLGLFEGRGIGEKWQPHTGEGPNRITLYRRAILDYWAESEETLGDIINHVLVHEIGHHFGLSDDDMTRIESGAGQYQ
jgi:predicted Zn-dependent protease with MMP-like domain